MKMILAWNVKRRLPDTILVVVSLLPNKEEVMNCTLQRSFVYKMVKRYLVALLFLTCCDQLSFFTVTGITRFQTSF